MKLTSLATHLLAIVVAISITCVMVRSGLVMDGASTSGPLGVCVNQIAGDSSTVTYIAEVAQPVLSNGVITCEIGTYVPVTPQSGGM